jgi:hypothetical protein
MNTLSSNGYIRTQASVLLYLLNLEKGRKFVAESNGNNIAFKSGKNGITSFKEGKHKEYALIVSNLNETMQFIEPILVESFPDKDGMLRFHCKEIIITKN